MRTYNADAILIDAVVEFVNEDTYGFTDDQHEAEIERLKRVVEIAYRDQVNYNRQRYGSEVCTECGGVLDEAGADMCASCAEVRQEQFGEDDDE